MFAFSLCVCFVVCLHFYITILPIRLISYVLIYVRIDVIEGDDRGIQASKDYMVSAGGNLARYSLTPSSAGAGAGASYTINKRPFTGTLQGSNSASGSSSSGSSGGGSMKVDMPIVAPSVHGLKVYNTLPHTLRHKHYNHILIYIYIYMYIYIFTLLHMYTQHKYIWTLYAPTPTSPLQGLICIDSDTNTEVGRWIGQSYEYLGEVTYVAKDGQSSG